MRFQRTMHDPEVLSTQDVDHLVAALAEIGRTLPIVLLYLHGSHARGTQGRLSDLDLAVLLEADAAPDRDRRAAVLSGLEKQCGRDDVDVVILNHAGSVIKDRVVRHGRLIFARSEVDRVQFEASVIKEALDFRYYGETYDRALFRQIREGRFLG